MRIEKGPFSLLVARRGGGGGQGLGPVNPKDYGWPFRRGSVRAAPARPALPLLLAAFVIALATPGLSVIGATRVIETFWR